MAKQKGPTYSSAAQAIIAELTQPISLDEFVQRVLERFPSRAKKPRENVRTFLRWEGVRAGLVSLDAKTLVPARIALQGVRFRVPLDKVEIKHGAVIAEPGFTPFVKSSSLHGSEAVKAEFFDTNDRPLTSSITSVPVTMPGPFGGDPETFDQVAFELRDWLSQQRAKTGDSLLVTVLDLEQARFRLEFEPRAQRRPTEIAAQNRAFADLVWAMLQDTSDEQLITLHAIPSAFARLLTAREYPGDHWLQVLNADQRMRVTDLNVVPADYRFPFEIIFDPLSQPAVAEQSFTPEQGRRVYRFRAAANYSRRRHIIEVLGRTTLADFDRAMRTAFRLDPMDHLSEFTRITHRGKGKMPHKLPYGHINPFERSAATKLRVAGLGLEINSELQYVYDFGDWLDHTLILEHIAEAEPGVTYPRAREAKRKSSEK